jgi:AcrR family transcriptional regulator
VPPARKERADSQRNRALVLVAARSAFATEGPDVPLDEIARRAGVGAGTVHRHFPTKNALLAGVVVDRLEEIAALATRVADADDPGTAFFDVVRRLTAEARENLVLTTALDGDTGPEIAAAAARLTAALSKLLDQAQRAGAVKPDITAGSLHAILGGVIAMERRLPEADSGLGLQIVLDGLRAR